MCVRMRLPLCRNLASRAIARMMNVVHIVGVEGNAVLRAMLSLSVIFVIGNVECQRLSRVAASNLMPHSKHHTGNGSDRWPLRHTLACPQAWDDHGHGKSRMF